MKSAETGHSSHASAIVGSAQTAGEDQSPAVLIVEDEELIASTMEMILSDKGYRVIGPVATIEEALAMLETTSPDAALLDYRIGGSTTESLLPILQERAIPVCVLTGYGREALPEAYRHCLFLEKPFNLRTLLDKLQELCG